MPRHDRVLFENFTRLGNDNDPEMAVNGSVTPVSFRVTNNGGGHPWVVHTVSFVASSGQADWPNSVSLANGVLFRMLGDDGSTVLFDWTGGGKGRGPIRTLGDFAILGADTPKISLPPNSVLTILWRLHDVVVEGGMVLGRNESLELLIRDDLSEMIYFRAQAHGTRNKAVGVEQQ